MLIRIDVHDDRGTWLTITTRDPGLIGPWLVSTWAGDKEAVTSLNRLDRNATIKIWDKE